MNGYCSCDSCVPAGKNHQVVGMILQVGHRRPDAIPDRATNECHKEQLVVACSSQNATSTECNVYLTKNFFEVGNLPC